MSTRAGLLTAPLAPNTAQSRGTAALGRRRWLTRAAWQLAAPLSSSLASYPTGAASATGTTNDEFSFAFIGDIPYSALELLRARELLAAIDKDCDFVIHVGDIKSGTDSCANEAFESRFALLRASVRPLIYVPGDNDWSDCLRPAAGGFRPYDRLDFLRRRLFNSPISLGRATMRFENQALVEGNAPEVEHLRWIHHGVLFLTVNRPGGVDLRRFTNDESDLYNQMTAAGERWLRTGFALARQQKINCIVVISHANPGFENDQPSVLRPPRRDLHRSYRRTLAELASDFTGDVLFLHGDTHRFQINQPLRNGHGDAIPNFTRVECFGSPFSSSWVRIHATPNAHPAFTVGVRHLENNRPF